MRSRFHWGRIAATALETVAWVGLATALVALLNPIATAAGLGSIYLIAVLAVAIRRGQIAALAAALLGVLTLNFFFIEPLHQLTISQSDNVVALGVLLFAALVVAPWPENPGSEPRRRSGEPTRQPLASPRPRCSRRPRRPRSAAMPRSSPESRAASMRRARTSFAWRAARRHRRGRARRFCGCPPGRARFGSTPRAPRTGARRT